MSQAAETGLVDVCVNLMNSQFRRDRSAVMARAAAAMVSHIVITATDLASTRQAIEYCQNQDQDQDQNRKQEQEHQYNTHPPFCVTTAGIHPHDAALDNLQQNEPDWLEQLGILCSVDQVRAVGETGLDFHRQFVAHADQYQVFEQQIALAQKINKPLFVHDRDTHGAVLRTLQSAGPLPPVLIHCFTGTRQDLEDYLDAGYYIGLTGWIADPERGQRLRELAPLVPLERLMLETDAPFLKPKSIPADYHQQIGLSSREKRRNEPGFLPFVIEAVAKATGQSAAHIGKTTAANAKRFFELD